MFPDQVLVFPDRFEESLRGFWRFADERAFFYALCKGERIFFGFLILSRELLDAFTPTGRNAAPMHCGVRGGGLHSLVVKSLTRTVCLRVAIN